MGSYSIYLTQGLTTGLVVACPIGPISVLCIQRSIQKGLASGFISALGASIGDAFYALIGAFSSELLVETLLPSSSRLNVAGGLLLFYLGVSIFRKRPNFLLNKSSYFISEESKNRWQDSWGDFITILVLNTINPMTILPFLAIFSSVYNGDRSSDASVWSGTFFVIGVFLTGILWRSLLSLSANYVGKYLKRIHMVLINRITGVTIVAFGFLAIYSAFSSMMPTSN